jgi:serine/threonine protein kinase
MDRTRFLTQALSGRYEVERELGAGGMATVYLARDLRHHRRVAIKVLRPELGAVLGAERFLSEIQGVRSGRRTTRGSSSPPHGPVRPSSS